MDWPTFFQDNLPTIVGVYVAILGIGGTLIGTMIGLSGGFVREWLSRKHEREKIELEWNKEYRESYLIKPIIEYIDETLTYMGAVYWSVLENRVDPTRDNKLDHEKAEKLNIFLREMEGKVRARVTALNNVELDNCFNKFSKNFGRFVTSMNLGNLGNAYTYQRATTKAGGEVYLHLQPHKVVK